MVLIKKRSATDYNIPYQAGQMMAKRK